MNNSIIKYFLFSLIITAIAVFKMTLFVPVRVTGGIAGINEVEYRTLFNLSLGCGDFVDNMCRSIYIGRYIVEEIVVLLLVFLVLFIIYKLCNGKKGDKNE